MSCKPVWDFDHLEARARKVVTGTELQTWATKLIAKHTNSGPVQASEVDADFAARLRWLAPQLGLSVRVSVPDDTNFPSCVQFSWGSGFLGHKGFLVGPTNFVAGWSAHAWQPGVYFYQK
jgi:hypothetical protein